MSIEHVRRERRVATVALLLFTVRKYRLNGISCSFQDAESFVDECELRERRARRKTKGKK